MVVQGYRINRGSYRERPGLRFMRTDHAPAGLSDGEERAGESCRGGHGLRWINTPVLMRSGRGHRSAPRRDRGGPAQGTRARAAAAWARGHV
jgi:hypothetical protein